MNDNEKIVEVARFQFPADAFTLLSFLQSEGIECYLRNENTAQLLSHMDTGGARLEVFEKDVPKVVELIKEGGYEKYLF
ncbi:MAG: DUF2007 domain-containing protein [Tannerellaceae bacterium]|nr:DUF2007 domain-containing protein [Tannerellaceae bacterium]